MTPVWEIGSRQKNTPMNKEAMYKNLIDFKEAMDKADIRFIWTFGGLLGLIRENDLIAWDNDVDFACFSTDHRKIKLVVDELKTKGFYVPDRNECPFGDHFFIRDGEKLEVWWYQNINNEWVYDNQIRYEARYFDDCEKINFIGQEWEVPNNPEEFLDVTYGETWKTPSRTAGYIL